MEEFSTLSQLKEEGNRHFKDKSYQSAIDIYSRAITMIEDIKNKNEIESEPYDKIMQLLPAFYSNRSACYMGMNLFDYALDDAKSCIKVNPSWSKGYSRKGAALRAKNLFSSASAAYTLAADFEGTGELADEYRALASDCDKEDRYQRGLEQRPTSGSTSSYSSSSGSASSSSTSYAEAYPTSAFQFLFGSRQRLLATFLFLLRIIAFICLPAVVIPVFEFSADCYQVAIISTMVNFVIQLFATYGRPRFDVMWAGGFLQDWRFSRFMIGMLYVTLTPSMVPLMVLLVTEVGHVAEYAHNLFSIIAPSVAAKMREFVKTSPLLAQFCETTIDDWSGLDTGSSWARYNRAVLVNGGRLEVVLVVTSVFGVILQQLSILTLFVLFQLMKVRYMISQETKDAFGELDLRIVSLIGNYPSVFNIYLKIKGYLSSQIQPPQERPAGGAEGGIASRMMSQCTIM